MAILEKGKLPEELVKILKSLALEWGDDLEDIDNNVETSALDGGGSINHIYKLRWPPKKDQSVVRDVLVRFYPTGMELFLDRKEEIETFRLISEQGEGPKLHGCLPNGRVEEFIHGRTLFQHELQNPEISALIADKVRRFHNLDRPGSKHVVIWDRLRDGLRNAERLCCNDYITEFSIRDLEEEINSLEKKLSKESQVVAFCHNDLHCGNILFNETTKSLTLIDYEFAGYNPIAYDFANYFCEMSSNIDSDIPQIMDFSKYPGVEERHNFIKMYLTSAGNHTTDLEVEQLADDAEKYTLACHLLYGLWGIIWVANANHNGGFDFLKHARERFQQYWLKKLELLGTPEKIVNANCFGEIKQLLVKNELLGVQDQKFL